MPTWVSLAVLTVDGLLLNMAFLYKKPLLAIAAGCLYAVCLALMPKG